MGRKTVEPGDQLKSLFAGKRLHQIDRAGDGVGRRKGFVNQVHLAGLDFGQVQHIVQNAPQRLAGLDDQIDLLTRIVGQVGA